MFNQIKFVLVATMLLTFISCSDEGDPQILENKGALKSNSMESINIMTWNVALLDAPDFITDFLGTGPTCEGNNCAARASAKCSFLDRFIIGTTNFSPDVVAFQEVFEPEARDAIVDCMAGLGYNEVHGTVESSTALTKRCNNTIIQDHKGSGLLTFSKLPIIAQDFREFFACEGCSGRGNDCFADKGMLLSDVQLSNGQIVRIVNVHLDSGNHSQDLSARIAQQNQINSQMRINLPTSGKVIAVGDFNTENLQEINDLENRLALRSVNKTVSTQAYVGVSSKILDHILIEESYFPAYVSDEEVVNECLWTYIISFPGSSEEERLEWSTFEEIPSFFQANAFLNCSTVMQRYSDHKPVIATITY